MDSTDVAVLAEAITNAVATLDEIGQAIPWAGVEIKKTPFALTLPASFNDVDPAGGNMPLGSFLFDLFVGFPFISKTGGTPTPTDLSARANAARHGAKVVKPIREFFAMNIGMCGGTTSTRLHSAVFRPFDYESKNYYGPVFRVSVQSTDSLDFELGDDFS